MTSLENYLRDQYQQDKQQLKRTLDVILQISPIFVKYYAEVAVDKVGRLHTWPYQVVNGTFPPIERFSDSTHSMILFVLDAILQGTGESTPNPNVRPVLCPPILRVPQLRVKRLSSVVRQAKLGMIKRLLASSGPLVTSATFGENDPFTLAWLAELLLRHRPSAADDVTPGDLEEAKKRIRRVAEEVCFREGHVLHFPITAKGDECPSCGAPVERLQRGHQHYEIPHCFQMLRSVLLAKAAAQFGAPSLSMLPLKGISAQMFLDHLHRQLGYYSIPDSRFDPAVLVFAMEGALQFDPHSLSDSTIESIYRTLESSQKGNSYWRPVTPFLSDSRGMVLFPVSVEISNSLLRSFELLHDAHRPTYSSQLEPLLRRYVQWLLARAERIGLDTDQVLGWHSEHVNLPGTVHLWETSQVLFFLVHYYSLLQRKIASDGLTHAALTVREWESIAYIPDFWAGEPLEALTRAGTVASSDPADKRYAVLGTIHSDFITERSSRSLMLYGPPGTGKTTVAEQLARSLRQPLVIVTVSDFLAGAADEVEARAKGIFQVLEEQENVVILFDEIDQFLLDRNGQRYRNQTGIFQFLTPGMLTKFQNLKDLGRSLFIVATNYEERIDSAIKRQGRFDQRLLLCLPDKERRKEFLWTFVCSKLGKVRADDSLFAQFQTKATDAPARDLLEAIKNDSLNEDLAAKGLFVSHAEDVLRNTALFGWGDLKYLVGNELEITPGDSWEKIGRKLSRACANVQPAVRINAYSRRFEEDEQAPSEEFVLLLYLVGEAGQKLSDEDIRWMAERGVSGSSLAEQLSTSENIKKEIRAHLPSQSTRAMGS